MIWTNTALFDSLILKKQITKNKEQATFIILGSGDIDITEFPNVKLVYREGVGTDNINFSNIPVVINLIYSNCKYSGQYANNSIICKWDINNIVNIIFKNYLTNTVNYYHDDTDKYCYPKYNLSGTILFF